jgi:hypothetical protein
VTHSKAAGDVPVPSQVQSTTSTPTTSQNALEQPTEPSESAAEAWIFNEESGNNPKAENSAGCLGIGQACPGIKLLAVCPTLDYNCEVSFFTTYMESRYGSWQAAYDFHIVHGWW